MPRRKLFFAVLIIPVFFYSFEVRAQVVSGRIINNQNQAVPYATIYIPEAKEGTISNAEGNFKIQLNTGNYKLIIRSMGYIQVEKDISVISDSLNLQIKMERQEFEIKEVKVFPGKEDPALDRAKW